MGSGRLMDRRQRVVSCPVDGDADYGSGNDAFAVSRTTRWTPWAKPLQ
jgi:hypothetical protein